MTIYKQETIPYDNGSGRNIYSFPSLKGCDELWKAVVTGNALKLNFIMPLLKFIFRAHDN